MVDNMVHNRYRNHYLRGLTLMKKQKKPIILVLLLAVLFGGVAFMNRPAPKLGEENAQQQPQDQPKDESAKDVASDVSKALDEPNQVMTPVGHGNHGAPPGPNGAGGMGSSLVKTEHAVQKPKPNLSNTAAQWYTDEANKK